MIGIPETWTYPGDEDVERWLNRVLASEHLTRPSYEHLKTVHSQFTAKVSRFFLINCASFLNITYYDQQLEMIRGLKSGPYASECSRNINRQREVTRLLLRPQLILFLLAYCWLTVSTIFQYNYDIRWIKLDVVRAPRATTKNGTVLEELEWSAAIQEAHLRELEVARRQLQWVGAPLIDFHFGIEYFSLFGLIMSGYAYLIQAIALNTGTPFNFRLARLHLDPRRESKHVSALIANEFHRFVASSRGFIEAAHSFKWQVRLPTIDGINICPAKLELANGQWRAKLQSDHHQLANDHRMTVRQLFKLTVDGQLQPASWSPNVGSFTYSFPKYHGAIVLAAIIYFLMNILVAVIIFEEHFISHLQVGTPDLIVIIVMFIIGTYMIAGFVFHNTFLLMETMGLIEHINTVITLVENSLQWNERNLAELLCSLEMFRKLSIRSMSDNEPASSSAPQCTFDLKRRLEHHRLRGSIATRRAQMNKTLLYALMQFRLFSAQFNQSNKWLCSCIFHSTVVMFMMPAVARLHLPYVERDIFKAMIPIACIAGIFFFNTASLPACRLRWRASKLYKALTNLVAHTIRTGELTDADLQQAHDICGSHSLYDRHLLRLLRKELHSTGESRFGFEHRGIQYGYLKSLEIHFWFGVFFLSFLERPDSSMIIQMFINDPLGVYSLS